MPYPEAGTAGFSICVVVVFINFLVNRIPHLRLELVQCFQEDISAELAQTSGGRRFGRIRSHTWPHRPPYEGVGRHSWCLDVPFSVFVFDPKFFVPVAVLICSLPGHPAKMLCEKRKKA